MRVPFSWLKEYIDCGLSPLELAERLTLAGVEVESAEPFRPNLIRVVAARVKTVRPHPGSQKLFLVTVDAGFGEVSVVCGASNVASGQIVPLALPGAVLPDNRCIETVFILGERSEGMICSPRELGLDFGEAAEAGILVLEPATAPGRAVDQVLGFDDFVLSLSLTPNRADCLGLLGVAYEVAALTGASLKLPQGAPPESEESVFDAVRVSVLDEQLCPRYTARVIRDLKVAPAPLWMQLKLLKAGIRPINNIVDITNYVMWEYGQPLHAFDYDLLAGKEIVVRRAASGETLVTLDGVCRSLNEEVLVIADADRPIGLAGVMGGESTEISPATRSVLLESARFNPVNIRRTARRYNLPSEASQRFERGVNPEATLSAQERASQLISALTCGRVLKGVADVNPFPFEPRRLNIRPHRINEILGLKIEPQELTALLERLSFNVEKGFGATLDLTVPAHRGDLLLEEDVAEEAARLYGYAHIPVTLPRGELIASRPTLKQQVDRLTRRTLAGCGFFEVITHSFINLAHLNSLRLEQDDPRRQAIPLKNPLSEEQGVMRTTLLPGLLKVLQHNFNHQETNQLLFEIGTVFRPRSLPLKDWPDEQCCLSLAATGRAAELSWLSSPPTSADFFLLKGALEALCAQLRIKDLNCTAIRLPFTHPARCAALNIGAAKIGFIGQLHPAVAAAWDFQQAVTLGELDLDALSAAADLTPKAAPLSRYPAARRDIAVVVSREIAALELERRIRQAGGELVDQVVLFDLYEGDQVSPGARSLAYSISFRSASGTLTDDQLSEAMMNIERALADLGAQLRR